MSQEEKRNNYKILIVEDELLTATHIAAVLSEKGHDVLDPVTKGEEVPGIVASSNPDLIIMDIQLAGQLDGIETAKIINQTTSTPVIFLTSNNDERTFSKSKDAFPHAFVSKPFNEDELLRTIEIVGHRVFATINEDTSDNVENEPQLNSDDSIFVRSKDKMIKLKISDIQFIEADRNYCTVHSTDKKHVLTMSLGAFEKKVSSPSFVRIHRSYIVNINNIDSINENYVFIKKNTLPMSKSYKQSVQDRLNLI